MWRHAVLCVRPQGRASVHSGAARHTVSCGRRQQCGLCAQDYPAVGRVTFFSMKRAEKAEGEEALGSSDWAADMIYTRSDHSHPRLREC